VFLISFLSPAKIKLCSKVWPVEPIDETIEDVVPVLIAFGPIPETEDPVIPPSIVHPAESEIWLSLPPAIAFQAKRPLSSLYIVFPLPPNMLL